MIRSPGLIKGELQVCLSKTQSLQKLNQGIFGLEPLRYPAFGENGLETDLAEICPEFSI